MKKIFTVLCLLLVCSAVSIAQTKIGYSNGEFNRSDGLRIGSGEKQGLAIKLSKEKLQLLKGKKIVGASAVFGTRNVKNLNFFLTKALGQQPLYEQSVSGAATNWKDFTFDTPYVVGDETELYLGYSLEASTSYRPLAFDRSVGIKGSSWAYSEGDTWVDVYDNGFGCADLYLLVEDVDPFTDLCLKTFSVSGYYKAENAYKYTGQVLNFGTQSVKSFDVTYQIGDNEPVAYSFTGINIAPNETFDFELPEYISLASGKLPIKMSVTNIDGAVDADMSDNVDNSTIFIYPSDMEKRILLEGFTGQGCSNCPAGHRVVEGVLEETAESIVEVFHHAGYQPDSFTMTEDGEYCRFYNDGTYFAPALMVNRMLNSDLGTLGPIFGVSDKNLEGTIDKAAAIQPYVSVGIENKFDNETRELKSTVKVHTYVMPDADINTLNVFVVQDSVIAMQSSGGDRYVHRYAFRGALTSAWGLSVTLEEGKDYIREFTYTLPDAIKSTYENKYSIPTDLNNMYLVAFVSSYSSDPNGCTVYNSNIAKFSDKGGSVGIEGTSTDKASVHVYVNGGRVNVQGDYSQLDVYDMAGNQVGCWNAPVESFTLDAGFYIIRAVCNGEVVSQKVAIMK